MFSSTKPDPKPCDGGCATMLEPIPLRGPLEGQWMSPRTCVPCAERVTPNGPMADPYDVRKTKCAGRQNAEQRHIGEGGVATVATLDSTPRDAQATLHAHLSDVADQRTTIGAYIVGVPGTGKTYLLKALVNTLRERKIDVCMFNDQELTAIMRSTQKPGSPLDVYDLISDLAEVSVLIIDDYNPNPGRAGADADADFRLTHLYDLLNRRYEAAKTTLITSNFQLDATAKVSPKLASRMRHKAWMRYFLIGGQDLRAA